MMWTSICSVITRRIALLSLVMQCITTRCKRLCEMWSFWCLNQWFCLLITTPGLANSEHSHPSGLLLKTRILLQYMPDSERLLSGEFICQRFTFLVSIIILCTALDDTLTHPDTSIEMASTAIRITFQYNRHASTYLSFFSYYTSSNYSSSHRHHHYMYNPTTNSKKNDTTTSVFLLVFLWFQAWSSYGWYHTVETEIQTLTWPAKHTSSAFSEIVIVKLLFTVAWVPHQIPVIGSSQW